MDGSINVSNKLKKIKNFEIYIYKENNVFFVQLDVKNLSIDNFIFMIFIDNFNKTLL